MSLGKLFRKVQYREVSERLYEIRSVHQILPRLPRTVTEIHASCLHVWEITGGHVKTSTPCECCGMREMLLPDGTNIPQRSSTRLEMVVSGRARARASGRLAPYTHMSREKLCPPVLPPRQPLPNTLAVPQPRLRVSVHRKTGPLQQEMMWRSRRLCPHTDNVIRWIEE